MLCMNKLKVRRVKTSGTVSYQLGRYEMRGESGSRRSAFKVEVHLGEYRDAEEALSAWPPQIERLRQIGREGKANTLQEKLNKLHELIGKGESDAG